MIDLLVEYKWWFLIGTEVLFWLFAIVFVLLRYWFERKRLSRVFLGLILVEEVVAELFILALGVLDLRESGQISTFQIVSVAALIYAFTLGRRDIKRVDNYLKVKVRSWKSKGATPAPVPATTVAPSAGSPAAALPEEFDWEHTRKERRDWYGHVALFAVGQMVFFVLGESWIAGQITGDMPEDPSSLMNAGRIWCVVLGVDAIWSFSYSLFPRKTKV